MTGTYGYSEVLMFRQYFVGVHRNSVPAGYFRPEPRFFRVPVPARTSKKSMAGTVTLSFSER